MEMDSNPKLRVVVSDDNGPMLRFICHILRPQFDVVEVVNVGGRAIDAVLKSRPDLLILEVLLPGLDGIQVVRRLRTLEAGCKIIMLTGLETREYIDAAMEAGAGGFVFKRRMATDLLLAITEVMSGGSFVSSDPSRD